MSNTSFQAPAPEHLAELMPQYDIEGFIAQGGMGAVYKGRQRSLDRDVAIKILPKELGDSEFRAAFATEAKAMARLNHPNLLGVFDFGEVDGMPYIAMEYVHGQSLDQASHNQAIDPLQAVEIVKGICDGLAHAHENDIVHRDIKPANVLLTQNAKPKIGDFGLAHAADSDQPGLMMGTPGYTAPEVFQDPDQAGPLADIYSVGVILHQLLTGIDPSGCLEPPTEQTGNIRLDSIWRKAVNIDPSQRYQTVESMAADLGKWTTTKTTNTLVSGTKPFTPSVRPVPVTIGSNGSGVSLFKWFLIVVLAAGSYFTYQLLQENNEDINTGTTNANGTESNVGSTLAPVPNASGATQPKPQPKEITHNELSDPPFTEPKLAPKEVVNYNNPDTPSVMALDPKPEANENLLPGDPELLKRAIDLIGDARKKRDKKLADNASSLISKLGNVVRGNKPGEGPTIDDFKKNIVDNRIPQVDASTGLPDKFSTHFKQALSLEEPIDTAYSSELTKIRDAYVSRLETAAADKSTAAELQKRLLAQAKSAKDLDAWIKLLSPEPQWTRTTMSNVGSSKGAVGKWINRSYKKESEWIAHPDGRMEIVGHDWKVTWKLLEDGTLKVDWSDEKTYTYTLKGDVWVGVNPHGGEATLTRGD